VDENDPNLPVVNDPNPILCPIPDDYDGNLAVPANNLTTIIDTKEAFNNKWAHDGDSCTRDLR
jgi:hypothetical protein